MQLVGLCGSTAQNDTVTAEEMPATEANGNEHGAVLSSDGTTDSRDGGENGGNLVSASIVSVRPVRVSVERATLEPSELVRRTRFPGVDCINGGIAMFPREGFATRRMSDLLDWSRKNYTLILVAGPPSDQVADLQMAAARADAVIFTLPSKQPLDRRAARSHIGPASAKCAGHRCRRLRS